jgi:fucose permease
MLSRFLLVSALGMMLVLLAVIAIVGYWQVAAVALVVGAVAVLVWAVVFGTGRRKLSDPDGTDRDMERAKTAQYYARDKARHTGGAG